MTNCKPLSDQILVKLLAFEDRIKSIWIPETVDHGRLPIRQGIVVALGCGDVVAPKCDSCKGSGDGLYKAFKCLKCFGAGYLEHERTTFTVAVGDRVLIHPRYWAEITIEGEPHVIIHEDQHVLAIIE